MEACQALLYPALERLGWPPGIAQELVSGAHIVEYGKGTMLFRAGESADLVYLLLTGDVKLHYSSEDGTRLLVGIVRKGATLGLFPAQAASEHGVQEIQLLTAQAATRVKVALISGARFTQALHRLPAETLIQMVGRLNAQWLRLSNRLLDFMTMDVRGRLMQVITELADGFGIADARGKLIPLRLSHEDFAEFVGASRPIVSKYLKRLSQRGVLIKQDGHYVLMDQVRKPKLVASSPASKTAASVRPLRVERVVRLSKAAVRKPEMRRAAGSGSKA
jgi:CRP-like cAMP-binding protein